NEAEQRLAASLYIYTHWLLITWCLIRGKYAHAIRTTTHLAWCPERLRSRDVHACAHVLGCRVCSNSFLFFFSFIRISRVARDTSINAKFMLLFPAVFLFSHL
ncbi:unnamed protein product, partial [Pylaiella littoralis]